MRFLEYIKFNLAIIFVNKKYYTVNLSDNLKLANYKICYLNGDMDQKLREKNIEDLKNKKYKILIATDVASRGLDIKDIDLVINYDIPNDINTYIHRIGRTGRAGNYGKSISFILKNEIYLFNKINKKFNNNINKISYPSNIEILELNLNKFIEKIKNNFEDIKNEKVDIKKYKNIIDKLLIFTENNIELLCIILFKIIQNNNYIYNIFSNNNKNNNSKYKMKINIGLQDKIKKYDILKKISEVMFIDINNIYIKLFNNYSILTINTDKNIKNNYNIYINKKIFKIKNLY
ncbi:C-terminal helicase domain-containing protein [Candidatus Nardonella dryophthoridicola]|uniref:C-terminal helicase domain-containing protein n=1 Tax=Candidatus Nardonella dryophthoridicola TaxID=1971485 RepID=UPI002A4E11F7|nr:C-terminal helicase domain-containing protein [Candidatus Nardonella dryophthoridicola]